MTVENIDHRPKAIAVGGRGHLLISANAIPIRWPMIHERVSWYKKERSDSNISFSLHLPPTITIFTFTITFIITILSRRKAITVYSIPLRSFLPLWRIHYTNRTRNKMSYQPLNDSSRPSTSPLPKQEKKSWWSSLIDIILFNINAAMYSGWPGQFWIQPLWSPEEITSQEGKVVLITGANSGVGLVSAKELYQAGATVYMLCRTEKKAKEAIDWIKSAPSRQGQGKGEGKGKLEFISLDLTDLKSVKRAAEEFLR